MRRTIGLFLLIIVFLVNMNITVSAKDMNIQDWINEDNPTSEEQGVKSENSPQDHTEVGQSEIGSGSAIFNIIKTLFVLGIIIVLIYFVLRFINKNKSFQKHQVIENLGGVSVGPNKSLQIIRIGGQFYLIGVGENVQMLDEITDENAIGELVELENEKKTPIQSTFGQFKQVVNRKDEKNSFEKLFANELNDLKQNQDKVRAKYEERNRNNE